MYRTCHAPQRHHWYLAASSTASYCWAAAPQLRSWAIPRSWISLQRWQGVTGAAVGQMGEGRRAWFRRLGQPEMHAPLLRARHQACIHLNRPCTAFFPSAAGSSAPEGFGVLLIRLQRKSERLAEGHVVRTAERPACQLKGG